MKKDLNQALEAVEVTYKELKIIADDMIHDFFSEVDRIVKNIGNAENLSVEQLRNYMLKLSIAAFELGEKKERSALKAQCAEALRKEAYALKFAEAQGTNGVKETYAILESSNEAIAEYVYDLVSSLFKTKMDSTHRLIDTLKSILMSRMSEAKLTMINNE